jgi:hypothetical protein
MGRWRANDWQTAGKRKARKETQTWTGVQASWTLDGDGNWTPYDMASAPIRLSATINVPAFTWGSANMTNP